MEQEIRPFLKMNDSFKKIVITSDTPKPFYTNQLIRGRIKPQISWLSHK